MLFRQYRPKICCSDGLQCRWRFNFGAECMADHFVPNRANIIYKTVVVIHIVRATIVDCRLSTRIFERVDGHITRYLSTLNYVLLRFYAMYTNVHFISNLVAFE